MDLSNTSTRKRILKQKALDIFEKKETTWKFVWKALAVVQESQSKQADKYWKDITYAIEDKVWLFTRNITTD